MIKLPKPNTRSRAVVDVLINHPGPVEWREVKNAYDNHSPAYALMNQSFKISSRKYSHINVRRILNKYADHIMRNKYVLKSQFRIPQVKEYEAVVDGPLPAELFLSQANIGERIKDDIAQLTKMYKKAENDLRAAALNYTDISRNLDLLLNQVK